MGRKEHKLQHDRIRSIAGLSMVELLIALFLGSLIVMTFYQLLITQNRTHTLYDDTAEMQQNLRAAMDRLSRDAMAAGCGKPSWSTINGVDASGWYNAGNGWAPYRVSTSGSNNNLDLIGCFNPTVSHLNADAAVGATAITLNNGEGANFNTSTLQDISIGAAENAKVMNVGGDTLTIDTNPAVGGNQGLLLLEPASSYACAVTWITYSLGADNTLYVDAHQGQGNQAVAQNIAAMTLTLTGKLLTINLTGRTAKPDRTTGQYITSPATNQVLLRN